MSGDILSSENESVVRAVADTLRVVAGWLPDEMPHAVFDAAELRRVADVVALARVTDWTFCPVCEEVACDGDCPLRDVRRSAGVSPSG